MIKIRRIEKNKKDQIRQGYGWFVTDTDCGVGSHCNTLGDVVRAWSYYRFAGRRMKKVIRKVREARSKTA